ncbi:mannose-1-phosphate guanylyltransferase/mannose-6-phosphate isomerase [Acidihalobacter aeolianus]|uniref:mannose-1-phosphate guanylyltransferase n=1 Tax=Acidihalobacter aeolianus TaxID=2792603 RepID=A0A1D8K9D9_9GAMM|nr:mannose-1-phosphate guanylyltransferase/mannose-6-phosphate isomerase [Acidihalobacter aeolianus]AOV17555.1 mannose-1-phosphate guanylyltransferase/mannose-6-phosphate isomerase [Acidihalobacter aeolianus]
MTQIVPIVLSGGSGTRLWPLSRHAYPKQFIPLIGELSLFQMTLRRLEGLPDLGKPCVVGNDEQRFMVAEQLRMLGVQGRILLEPVGRNTAPAIAAAALDLTAEDPKTVMLVLPADHLISDTVAFHAAVKAALPAAQEGALVTFGVVPTRPETGYGYIEAGDAIGTGPARRVARFVEKPDLATAEAYVAGGHHWWNSGMFLFTAEHYLQAMETHAPAILEAVRRAHALAREDLDFLRLDAKAFAASPSDSIDYAVMERTQDAVVVPLDAGWNDVGSWQALWEVGAKDAAGNLLEGDVIALDCRDSYVHADHRLVAVLGLDGVVVAETADAVLVAPRDRVQEVKAVVGHLKHAGREEGVNHRRVMRPWGAYEGISQGDRFQVKRITVKPGERLSLQMHHHRAEHWIVVRGTARVTRGDEVFTLAENESTYIPLGVTHRLENPGRIELEMIEVQSGSYLGEDDIVRFEDSYGRG